MTPRVLFPRTHYCCECGKPVEFTSRWSPFAGKVRCPSCNDNWGEVIWGQ